MQGTIDECLMELFSKPNPELVSDKDNYNTIASWKFQFQKQGLSTEKKREILRKYGFTLKTQEKWQKRRV